MNTELSNFAARIRFAGARHIPDHEFNTLALDLFALQFKYNSAYQRICAARSLTPGLVTHWIQIPSVPAAAFKEWELSCLAPDERTAVFHSSGTTEQVPSRHFHCARSLEIYEASLWNWFAPHVLNTADFELLILTPPPCLAPHSSLVHMFEIVRHKLRAPATAFVGTLESLPHVPWTLDFPAAIASLKSSRRPLLILGTAFSFVHLLDHLAARNLQFRLPPGSRVMETGGYKNRSRSLPKTELHRLITTTLGISKQNIICEYGMSELSSQAYHANPERSFRFPPWARARVISPETENVVADGETGLIRLFDLANVFSVAAIQTEDLAVRRGDAFELIGRAPSAEPRGCSLNTSDSWQIFASESPKELKHPKTRQPADRSPSPSGRGPG